MSSTRSITLFMVYPSQRRRTCTRHRYPCDSLLLSPISPLPPRANIRRVVDPGSAYVAKAPRTVLTGTAPFWGTTFTTRLTWPDHLFSHISQPAPHLTASAPSPNAPSCARHLAALVPGARIRLT